MTQIARLKDPEISNGNVINADDLDSELNQLVNEANSQDTRITTIESGAFVQSGTLTTSNNLITNGISERTAASGVTIDSVLIKDGFIKTAPTTQPYVPVANGEIGLDTTNGAYKGMIGGSVVTFQTVGAFGTITSRSSNTILAAADKGTTFVYTSTFTQTLTAAATLGSGWFVWMRNDGTGIITIDANSTETINGSLTFNLYPGQSGALVCDGSNFKTVGISSRGPTLITSATASGVATVDITTGIDSTFDSYLLKLWDVVPATNSTNLTMRVSLDGGSSWRSTASDYLWMANSLTSASSSSTGDTSMTLNYTGSTDGQLSNSATATFNMDIAFNNPAGTSRSKTFTGNGSCVNAATRTNHIAFGGAFIGATSAVNGLRFYMSSGNISLNYALYGWRKT